MSTQENRAVITVVGLDQKGVISTVSTLLADNGVNILDISQTIMGAYFTMVMVVDLNECIIELDLLSEKLKNKGHSIGMEITCQHESLFKYMHRI